MSGNTNPARGRAHKRESILNGALRVFARDGFSRATVEDIAAEASVSTRTIYNHFHDKSDLFTAVMHVSANRVAEAQIAIMTSHLRRVIDIEADLVEFALDWVSPMPDYTDHAALVTQINAGRDHIPPAAIEAWRAAGPQRVLRELGSRFANLADQGLLAAVDPVRAARHFAALMPTPNPPSHVYDASRDDLATQVSHAVHAFLHGHLPR